MPQILYILCLFNTFNTPLTLLNFHKRNVSRGTLAKWMFHVEQSVIDVSRETKC